VRAVSAAQQPVKCNRNTQLGLSRRETLSVEQLKAREMLTALRTESATAQVCLAFEVFAAWIES
jgi:hypothetical protein